MTESGHGDIHGGGSGQRGDTVITATSIPGVDITWKQWAQGQLSRYGVAGIVAVFLGYLVASAYRDAATYMPKALEGFKEHNAQQRKDHLESYERQAKSFIDATERTDKRHLEMIQLLREGKTLSARSVDLGVKQLDTLRQQQDILQKRTQELEKMIDAIKSNKKDVENLRQKQDDHEQQLSQLLSVPHVFPSTGGS